MRVPYPDIAKRLGTTTGAVCGKVHRLGIGKGPRNPDRLYLRASKPDKPQMTPDAAYFAIMRRQKEEAAARQGLTIALEASDDHHCRYIIGDPARRQLCGARRKPGTPYCEEHAALCLGRKENDVSPEGRIIHSFVGRRNSILALPKPLTAVDSRTFEEIDAPEPAAASAA